MARSRSRSAAVSTVHHSSPSGWPDWRLASRKRSGRRYRNGRDVLPVARLGGVGVGSLERGGRGDLHVEALGEAAGKDVGGVVGPRSLVEVEGGGDDRRVGQRTVAGEAHHRAGRVAGEGQAVPAQHVSFGPSHHREPDGIRHGGNRVIAGQVARGDDHGARDGLRDGEQAAELELEHRHPAEIGQDLARQPGRAGPRLHDDERSLGHRTRWARTSMTRSTSASVSVGYIGSEMRPA